MFAIMSFRRIRRLRVLKFLWLDSWIRMNVPPLTPLCTKANNVKKPVRYTSIKKAKPKTIIDIAKLLQQKAKETKEKKQSASALKSSTGPTKPTPNKLKDQSDAKEIIISTAKVQTSSSTLPTKDAVDSYTAGLHNKAHTEMLNTKYAASQAVESAESPAITAASAQEEIITNISQVSEPSSTNPSEVISSFEDVASASEKHAGESSDGTVYVPDVMVTSKVMATPEISSVHEKGHLQETFDDSQAVAVASASTLVDIAQLQDSSQPQSILAPAWSSNVKAGKPSSGQEIITQALESSTDGTAKSILDIPSAEAVAVASGEDPTLREVCHITSSPQSTEHLPVVETTSAFLSKAVDAMSDMSADAQRSISLKDPILVQTEVLEEEDQTEAAKELTEAQLDPIQKLFLDKIREYSTKSQASGGPVDAGPEFEKAFSEELNKLQRLYGSGDLTVFPEFKFSEPELDESSSK